MSAVFSWAFGEGINGKFTLIMKSGPIPSRYIGRTERPLPVSNIGTPSL